MELWSSRLSSLQSILPNARGKIMLILCKYVILFSQRLDDCFFKSLSYNQARGDRGRENAWSRSPWDRLHLHPVADQVCLIARDLHHYHVEPAYFCEAVSFWISETSDNFNLAFGTVESPFEQYPAWWPLVPQDELANSVLSTTFTGSTGWCPDCEFWKYTS